MARQVKEWTSGVDVGQKAAAPTGGLWYQVMVRCRGSEHPLLGRILVPLVLLLGTALGTACRQEHAVHAPVPQATQLTLAVAGGPRVSPALLALVRLVAEQELRRAGLHPRVHAAPVHAAPGGVLALILERRPGGKSRLNLNLLGSTRSLETRFDFGRCCAPAQVAELRRQLRRLLTTVAPGSMRPPRPLWMGSRYNRDQLLDALAAGVHWLLAKAQRTGAFELSDLQQVFLILRESARDPALRRLAAKVGPQLSHRFRQLAPLPRATTTVAKLFDHAAGTYFAQRFGVTTPPKYTKALALAFGGAPPKRLLRRTATATASDPARDLLDELVDLYFPYKLGLPLPVRYADVVTRAARYPFRMQDHETALQLEDRMYLATHIVYVLSDFNESGLNEADLPRVVRFLERASKVFLAADDVETLGEVGDALKIVGRGYKDPLIRRVVERLLRAQNPDGSWGDMRDKDSYRRYHTTWTCFNGLLEFRFSKRGMTDATIGAAWRRGAGTGQPTPSTRAAMRPRPSKPGM
jgi:hypothetical protein